MVNYSPRAAKAIGYLKSKFNEVEIFVEDTCNPQMWVRLIKSCAPNLKIDSVTMLGGRKNVTDACRLDQVDDGRRRLYIVDGDFDYVLGKAKARLKYLYRLRAYCVENLLISEAALIDVAADASPDKKNAELRKLLDFGTYSSEIRQTLFPLFVTYAAAFNVAPAVKTVSYSVNKLLKSARGQTPQLDHAKVRSRLRGVYRESIKLTNLRLFRAERLRLERKASTLSTSLFVSGKDYLLPLYWMHMRNTFKYAGTIEQFKSRLAKSFDASADPWLTRRLKAL